MLLLAFIFLFLCFGFPLRAIPDRSFAPSCPALPSRFCFYLSLLTCQIVIMLPHMCYISCFHFLLPARPLVGASAGGGCEGRSLCHHGSLCSLISIECGTGSVRLGRMLYGAEILRERNDGWESLSEPQAKHFLTSFVGVDEL